MVTFLPSHLNPARVSPTPRSNHMETGAEIRGAGRRAERWAIERQTGSLGSHLAQAPRSWTPLAYVFSTRVGPREAGDATPTSLDSPRLNQDPTKPGIYRDMAWSVQFRSRLSETDRPRCRCPGSSAQPSLAQLCDIGATAHTWYVVAGTGLESQTRAASPRPIYKLSTILDNLDYAVRESRSASLKCERYFQTRRAKVYEYTYPRI